MNKFLFLIVLLAQFGFSQDSDYEGPYAPEPTVEDSTSYSQPTDYYEGPDSYGSKKSFWNTYTYAAAGLAGAGLISVVYGVLQQQEFNDRLNKMQAIEKDPRYAAYSRKDPVLVPGTGAVMPGNEVPFNSLDGKSYKDLKNEKEGAEFRRNAALVFGALCIGGSVVLFTF